MFWVKYIETVGTGLNDLFDSCADAGLSRPTIEANNLHFRLVIWRRENTVADKQQITANKSQIKLDKTAELKMGAESSEE